MIKSNSELQDSIYDKAGEIKVRPAIQIPESRGDFVDQAQDQIECDINEQIYQIRKRLQNDQKKYDLERLSDKYK